MNKTILKHILVVCLLALPTANFAQSVNRAELLEKTWHFVAMKCPDKIANGNDDQFINYYASLRMTPSNAAANINYGTYVKIYHDQRDNKREVGSYAISTDESNGTILTLKQAKTGEAISYRVPMVETNHLTLIRTDDGDKCNTSYAVAP